MTTKNEIRIVIPECDEAVASTSRDVEAASLIIPAPPARRRTRRRENADDAPKTQPEVQHIKRSSRRLYLVEQLERFLRSSGDTAKREERQRFVHPAYQHLIKRRFRKRRVRFGTSKLAVRPDLLRAAQRVKRRTLLYKPIPRVPLYYCRRCALASDIPAKLIDHICTKKATINPDFTDMEKLQKLVQIGPRTRIRDAHAILERLPYPQWARLARFSSAIHYNLVERFYNPPSLMDIAYRNVERYMLPEYCTLVRPTASDYVDFLGDDDDKFEIVECDGNMVLNYCDLPDEDLNSKSICEKAICDSGVESMTSGTILHEDENGATSAVDEDIISATEKPPAENDQENLSDDPKKVSNGNGIEFSESMVPLHANREKVTPPRDEMKSLLESQLRSEFDSSESSIPNSPELGFPLRRKISAESINNDPLAGIRNNSKLCELQRQTAIERRREFNADQPNESEIQRIDDAKVACALNGVCYFCPTCDHLFATYSNYDRHMALSDKSNGSCAFVVPNPIEVEVKTYDELPASGRQIPLFGFPQDDEVPGNFKCTKCHRNDFLRSTQLHAHIFDCALT